MKILKRILYLLKWCFIKPGFRFRLFGETYLRQWPWYGVYSGTWYVWERNFGKWYDNFFDAYKDRSRL